MPATAGALGFTATIHSTEDYFVSLKEIEFKKFGSKMLMRV